MPALAAAYATGDFAVGLRAAAEDSVTRQPAPRSFMPGKKHLIVRNVAVKIGSRLTSAIFLRQVLDRTRWYRVAAGVRHENFDGTKFILGARPHAFSSTSSVTSAATHWHGRLSLNAVTDVAGGTFVSRPSTATIAPSLRRPLRSRHRSHVGCPSPAPPGHRADRVRYEHRHFSLSADNAAATPTTARPPQGVMVRETTPQRRPTGSHDKAHREGAPVIELERLLADFLDVPQHRELMNGPSLDRSLRRRREC